MGSSRVRGGIMNSFVVGMIAFVCTFGGVLLGISLRSVLREHHLAAKSEGSVKVAIGLIATMTALVLGLVTASAKSSFDSVDAAVKQSAIQLLALDRTLARYGPETAEIRTALKHAVGARIDMIWPHGSSKPANLDLMSSGAGSAGEKLSRRNPQPEAARRLPAGAQVPCVRPLRNDDANQMVSARWYRELSSPAVPCGSPILAHGHIRELWGVFGTERSRHCGSLCLCAVYQCCLISRIGDGRAVRRLDQGLRRPVAVRI